LDVESWQKKISIAQLAIKFLDYYGSQRVTTALLGQMKLVHILTTCLNKIRSNVSISSSLCERKKSQLKHSQFDVCSYSLG